MTRAGAHSPADRLERFFSVDLAGHQNWESRMNVRLPESREKEIFLELFKRPEKGTALDLAVAAVAERHGVSMDEVKEIERKGMARDWPPLD